MSGRLNLGFVGVAGQGARNLAALAREHVVALCDIDGERLDYASALHPGAKRYRDFRELLAQPSLDAVVVSTPDHTHAPIALAAMRAGKHVYCEKPLARTVEETRTMARVARESGVVTQMGNQTHAMENYRTATRLIRGGAIGSVEAYYAWTELRWSGGTFPADQPPLPSHVDWDAWLGPAPWRPYHPAYHPFWWRGWWNFGTGSIGDLGCHLLDPLLCAVETSGPTWIEAEGPPPDPEVTPQSMTVRYTFGCERGELPVTLQHGSAMPNQTLFEGTPRPAHGGLFVGSLGKLLVEFNGANYLIRGRPLDLATLPPMSHHEEWVRACRSGGVASCEFSYAATLTEAVLLGNVAYRSGYRLNWDAAEMRAIGCPEAEAFVRSVYRPGWHL